MEHVEVTLLLNAGMLLGFWMIAYSVRQFLSPKKPSPMLPKAKEVRSRYIYSLNRLTVGTARLCGYHLAATMRPRQLAILDSSKCELCAVENKKTKSQ